MFKEEYLRLERCGICHEEIMPNEKMAMVHEEDSNKFFVHSEECLDSYKDALFSPKAMSQGMIIGMCMVCCKPVRINQKYDITRTYDKDSIGTYGEDPTLYTFPDHKHEVRFVHKRCAKAIGYN